MTDIPWTSARVDTLETLWRNGASCGLIGEKLGGISRNAVIGKVHRLKLHEKYPRPRTGYVAHRAPPRTRARTTARPRIPRARVEARPPRPIVERPAPPSEPTPRMIALVDLQPAHCRWPIGDPQVRGFAFCGCDRPTVQLLGKVEFNPKTFYCPFHTKLARQ